MERVERRKDNGMLNRRQRHTHAFGQSRAAKHGDRCADRAVNVARRPRAAAAAESLSRSERQRSMAACEKIEIVRIEMAEARDELDKHRQQREPFWRAVQAGPPVDEASKHRGRDKRKAAAVTRRPFCVTLSVAESRRPE